MLNIVLLGISKEPPMNCEEYELHRLLWTLLTERLEVTENALSKYIARSKKRNISKSETIVDIMEDYELDEDEATKKVEMYWE